MYSGFVTHKRVITRVGIHQRFDMAAYRLISPYISEESFPSLKDILHFEGYNGPDGLKVKSPKVAEPSHLYDPLTDQGEVPMHIENHYRMLVDRLKAGDMIRGAFEASWMAHYICDGLTPAHHFPLEEKLLEARESVSSLPLDTRDFERLVAQTRKYWQIWGAKGHYTTHFNFEMGIAFALVLFPIRARFSEGSLARARSLGPLEFFKEEARAVAELELYDKFYADGWSADIAGTVKNVIAPQTAATIGYIWLLALLEAGFDLAVAPADEE